MQQLSEAHKDLLRNLIDQQLWLSKGKELGINGETELVNRLTRSASSTTFRRWRTWKRRPRIRVFLMKTLRPNIRNQIVTQEVMRQEVGQHVSFTPGEVERFFEAHKQEYAQPESVRLSEILVSTGTPTPTPEGVPQDDPAKVAAAKAKADDIVASSRGARLLATGRNS